ncbi:MAG: hypothetical protein AAFO86_01065, partial [Pseudomonadota bacterium]
SAGGVYLGAQDGRLSLDDTDNFVKLFFKGERFNGEFIPVDVLPSVAAYENTLIEMAKAIWREENPERTNLPKNFSASFKLGLSGIAEGSKVAELPRQHLDGDLFVDDSIQDVFLEAQQRLARIVSAANENREFDPLPDGVVVPFERLRKPMSQTEVLEIDPVANSGSNVRAFRLSAETVDRVVNRSRITQTRNIDDVGYVVGLSEAPPSIKVVSGVGTFTYPIEWTELRSSDALRIGSFVSFSIFGETDAAGKLRKLISAKALSSALPGQQEARIFGRIEECSALSDGWLDGEGAGVGQKAAIRSNDIARFLARKYDDVRVYPDEDGGIQFEWVVKHHASSLLVTDEEFLLGVSDLNSSSFREKVFKGLSFGFLNSLSSVTRFIE